ncbi:MAG: Verru_Chthon cassette protein C [Verrucomicrobiales bacterium]|nr:Verru_Chthon cassette protein C [Verrucomicrobiales bacterium]
MIPPVKKPAPRGFSLIELLVAVALLSVVLLLVMQMVGQTQKTWKTAKATVGEFKDARIAFEAMTRRLSQATLNTQWDYTPTVGIPTGFARRSDLHFVTGPADALIGTNPPGGAGVTRVGHSVFFHAPIGLTQEVDAASNNLRFGGLAGLLNGWGYFVEFNTDEGERPDYLNGLDNKPKARPRYRLMEFRQPSENLRVFTLNLGDEMKTKDQKTLFSWFNGTNIKFCVNCIPDNYTGGTAIKLDRTNQVLGENILALVILPCDTVDNKQDRARIAAKGLYLPGIGYVYDSQGWRYKGTGNKLIKESQNVLPPMLDVTMIAVDESDFSRYMRKKGLNTEPGLLKSGGGGQLFSDPTRYDEDLESLKKSLSGTNSADIQYRIFRATIRLREAKWSEYQIK